MPLTRDEPRSYESDQVPPPERDAASEEHDPMSLPAHLNPIKNCLLDFDQMIGLEAIVLVLNGDDVDRVPLSAYKIDAVDSTTGSQRAQEREFLQNAQSLARNAKRLEEGLLGNSHWRRLFQNVLRNRMEEVSFSDSFQRGALACAENEVWDTNLDPYRSLNANPKPDLCFGFPVYGAEHQESASFRNNPSLRNYTAETLSQLAIKGLRAVPTTSQFGLLSQVEIYSTQKPLQLMCFPWFIVQSNIVHQPGSSEEHELSPSETVHQASIAASSALALLEKLARFADSKVDGIHIPPVVAITLIESKVTVWLAFSDIIDHQNRHHQMTSIWEGEISKIWDAIQFYHIVDNLFSWSRHILKPMITQYLDQWKLRHCPEVNNYHSRLEEDDETADIVHRIQDRLSSLNLTPGANLPDLIQQAVVFQEVMRPDSRIPKPTSINSALNVTGKRRSYVDDSSDSEPDNQATKASDSAMFADVEKKATEVEVLVVEENVAHSQNAKEFVNRVHVVKSVETRPLNHRSLVTNTVVTDDLSTGHQVGESMPHDDWKHLAMVAQSRGSRENANTSLELLDLPTFTSQARTPHSATPQKHKPYHKTKLISFGVRTIQYSAQPERTVPGYQKPEISEASPLKKRIPWRDKHINIKLPPFPPE